MSCYNEYINAMLLFFTFHNRSCVIYESFHHTDIVNDDKLEICIKPLDRVSRKLLLTITLRNLVPN